MLFLCCAWRRTHQHEAGRAGDPFLKDGSAPRANYMAGFYRSNESKPWGVRDFTLGLSGTLYGNSYGGGLAQPPSVQPGQAEDMQADHAEAL